MDIRIFTRHMILTDVYDGALEIAAEERFADAGTFSLTVPMADSARFTPEGILDIPVLGGGYVIEGIEKNAASMTAKISGRGVLSYFSRRALSESRVYRGTAEEVLSALAVQYGQDVLPAPLTVAVSGLSGEVYTCLGGGALLSAMRSVCDGCGMGMSLAVREGGFTFGARAQRETGEGLTRSLGDLSGGVHRTDVKSYINRVIVCAPGGYTVTVDAAGLFFDGIDDAAYPLREKYHYAEGFIRSQYETEELFREALFEEGRRILTLYRPRFSASVSVSSDAAARLTPGGIYTLEDELFGIRSRVLCTAKSVHMDSGGTKHKADMTVLPA